MFDGKKQHNRMAHYFKCILEMKHETSSGLNQLHQGEEAMHVMRPFEDNSCLSF